MNINTKHEILKIIQNVKNIHINLHVLNNNEYINSLTQCQEYAVNIGNIIENSDCNDKNIVPLLENYCEVLYELSLINPASERIYKIKLIDDLINNVESLIGKIAGKYRIVFLPYKAQMWDALESVWLAAKDDDRCECDVIPIPYFEFDKRKNEWHLAYDGNEFPSYVPITPYQTYSIRELKPDAAYIHYPYDGSNTVTRIHPAYYSDELKKYVNKLIYIPYYVTAGAISENHKYFPVYKNMDYFIVQSEFFKRSCTGVFYYDKIIPLGSPKIDSVVNKCKNEKNIPDEWKKILNNRKVLMLNTTIGDILCYKGVLIKKLQHFFELIAQRKDIALIWRPHPLTEATIKSMRTEIYESYIELKRYFMDNEIGVFDTTPDIAYTIAVSDGYIGSDGSSVINMFSAAGKPVFIFNDLIFNEFSENEKRNLRIINMVVKENELYFVADSFSGIFRFDITNFKDADSNYIGEVIDNSEHRWQQPYGYICTQHDDVYIASVYSDYITKYDGTNYKTFICNEKYDARALGQMKLCDNFLVFLPYEGFDIWKYDTLTGEWTVDKITILNLYKNLGTAAYGNIAYSCVYFNGCLWIVTGCSDYLLKYNVNTGESELHKNGVDKYVYTYITADENRLYLLDNINNIIAITNDGIDCMVIKIQTSLIKKYWNTENGELCLFKAVLNVGNYIVLIPAFSDTFIKINKITNEQSAINTHFLDNADGCFNGYNPEYSYSTGAFAVLNSYEFIVQRTYDGKAAVINVDDINTENVEAGNCREFYIKISNVDLEKKLENSDGFEKMCSNGYFCQKENIYLSTEQFLDRMVSCDWDGIIERQQEYVKSLALNPGTCGEKVHEFVMNSLIKC